MTEKTPDSQTKPAESAKPGPAAASKPVAVKATSAAANEGPAKAEPNAPAAVVAKAAPKAPAIKNAVTPAVSVNGAALPVKRGRGRPRKSEAEKAATFALRKQRTAAKRRAAVVPPSKPAAAQSTQSKFERKPTVTIDINNLFPNLGAVPGTEQFQAAFAEANAKGREALSKSAKVAEEFVELTKANVEAVVSSGRIASAGVQALSQDALAYGKEGVETASAAVKSFTEAKSPTELFQLQSEFARASFDRMLSNSSKLTESLVKLVGETIEPLSSRASVNASKINTLIA